MNVRFEIAMRNDLNAFIGYKLAKKTDLVNY